jgi:glycosyltransferase involved in cell wall biosynthesis
MSNCFGNILKTVNQYAPHSYEVMFVDNNSNDKFKGWLKWIQGCFASTKVIYNNEDLKFCKAANQGFTQAINFSDYVIILDSNTLPKDGWLFPMVQIAESDPKIAIVGAKIIKPGTNEVIGSGCLLKNGELIDPYLNDDKFNIPRKLTEERLIVDTCMLFKSSILKEFGLIKDDESKEDYMIRLRKAGYKVVYTPTTEIEYFGEREIGNISEKYDLNIEMPKVAVIMPAYNSSQFIGKSIDSILAQSYRNFKLFIMDDYSTDNTKDVLKKYKEKDVRLFLILLDSNGGTPKARNAGINTILWEGNLEGFKYIFFLDSDDLWNKNYLEKMVIQLESENDVGMMYSLNDKKFEDGSVAVPYGFPDNVTIFDKDLMIKQNYISPSFVGVTVETIKKIGKFCEDLSGIEDWDLWSRIANAGINIKCYPEVLGTYIVRKNSNAGIGNQEKLNLLRERQNKSYEETKC